MTDASLEASDATRGETARAKDSLRTVLPMLPMQPILKTKVWGGTHFSARDNDETGPIGESWQIADLAEGVTKVAAGPMAGASLQDLVVRFGEPLVGKRAPPGRFPFLVKVIDTAEMLSVQVHPDSEGAQQIAGAASKEETWYFLEDKGAVLHGLKHKTERGDFESALRSGTVTELLVEVPARRGEILHVPPGTLHAIGANVLLLEVQEPSDTTFRVWDHGRLGLDGKARPLHVDEALRVSSFEPAAPQSEKRAPIPISAGVDATLLVDTRCYRMEEVHMQANTSWRIPLNGDTCVLATLIDGNVRFSAPDEQTHPARELESVLFPASMPWIDIDCTKDATIILVGLGGCPLASPDGIL